MRERERKREMRARRISASSVCGNTSLLFVSVYGHADPFCAPSNHRLTCVYTKFIPSRRASRTTEPIKFYGLVRDIALSLFSLLSISFCSLFSYFSLSLSLLFFFSFFFLFSLSLLSFYLLSPFSFFSPSFFSLFSLFSHPYLSIFSLSLFFPLLFLSTLPLFSFSSLFLSLLSLFSLHSLLFFSLLIHRITSHPLSRIYRANHRGNSHIPR